MNASKSIGLRRNPGFTLVELIVASTLMTIVLAGIYTTFSVAINSWRGGEVNYQTYQDARRALGTLTRELRAIPPETLHLVNGYEDSIEFITLSAPMYVESGASERLLWVEYRLERGDNGAGMTLVREEALVEGPLPVDLGEDAPLEPLDIDLGRAHAFELATGVRDLAFYYQWAIPEPRLKDQPPQRSEIVGDRVVERRLPEGIRITLSLHDAGRATEEQVSTFRGLVTFRAAASPVPAYLDPRRERAR